MVNPEGTKIDPVYGYANDVLESDHIVPMKEIVDMPGFSQLSREQQIEVLNLKDNFIGLGKSTNASKGAKNWTDWQGHSKLGEIPSDVRTRMLELDATAREALMKAIEEVKKMIKVTKNINENLFIVTVESYLKEQAEELLNVISKIEFSKFKDKFTIQIGFTIFTLQKIDEGFIILSLDYSKNPLTNSTEDLTIALWIQLEQGTLLNKLNLTGELISFQDKIICSKGVLKLDNIYLERSGECEKGDSGWYTGPVDEVNANEELQAYYAYQIIKIRPSIIQALTLPSRYMAVFNKDRLEAVLDDNDIDVLKRYNA